MRKGAPNLQAYLTTMGRVTDPLFIVYRGTRHVQGAVCLSSLYLTERIVVAGDSDALRTRDDASSRDDRIRLQSRGASAHYSSCVIPIMRIISF